MKDKQGYKKYYQASLSSSYQIMDGLVKKGRMVAGWQKDKEVIRKVKKAARLFARREIERDENKRKSKS